MTDIYIRLLNERAIYLYSRNQLAEAYFFLMLAKKYDPNVNLEIEGKLRAKQTIILDNKHLRIRDRSVQQRLVFNFMQEVEVEQKPSVRKILLDLQLSLSSFKIADIKDVVIANNVDNINNILFQSKKNVNFGIINQHKEIGARNAYNHYFGSVILPLINITNTGLLNPDLIYFMIGNAPFDVDTLALATHLNIKMVILDHEKLLCSPILLGRNNKIEHISLQGLDWYWNPNSLLRFEHYFRQLKTSIANIFSIDFTQVNITEPKILIVERKTQDYYVSRDRKNGSERRSITNTFECYHALQEEYTNVHLVAFEGMDLFEKAALVNSCDIIIMQHGSALLSLLFMRKGTACIEIEPIMFQDSNLDGIYPKYAGASMASMNEIYHCKISQQESHDSINIQQLLRCVSHCRNSL